MGIKTIIQKAPGFVNQSVAVQQTEGFGPLRILLMKKTVSSAKIYRQICPQTVAKHKKLYRQTAANKKLCRQTMSLKIVIIIIFN